MNPQQSKTATQATLGCGALVTIAALAHAGGGASSLLSGFTIWPLLPYAVLLASSAFASTSGRALAAFIVSLLAAGFALLVYGDALFGHTSSMSGLVFVFIPLYQLIVAVILLAVLFFSRPSNANRNALTGRCS